MLSKTPASSTGTRNQASAPPVGGSVSGPSSMPMRGSARLAGAGETAAGVWGCRVVAGGRFAGGPALPGGEVGRATVAWGGAGVLVATMTTTGGAGVSVGTTITTGGKGVSVGTAVPVGTTAGGAGVSVRVSVGGAVVAVGGTGVAVGVAVGGTAVSVGGAVVAVGGTAVSVGGTLVAVGGTAVAVGGTLVAVGGSGVSVGGTLVAVGVALGLIAWQYSVPPSVSASRRGP